MDYSLIANSGIQLLTKRIEINLNAGFKCRFAESFDDERFQWKLEFAYTLSNQTVVLTSQLREKGYLDNDNNLTTSEAVILANPEVQQFIVADNEDASGIFFSKLASNNKFLESYFNVWLPMPFIEKDDAGDYKKGPYNWSKFMIVPRGTNAGILTADVVLAFDTRACYNTMDVYKEYPVFMSDGETEKRFGLCGNERHLIDYCTWNNNWVRDYIMEIAYPNAKNFDMLELKDGRHKYEFLATYLMLIKYFSSLNDFFPTIKLMRDRDVNVVNVEMIIDIGNSRTSALLFENNQFTQDFTKVDPLRLQNFTHVILPDGNLNRVEETFDMRLAFRKVKLGKNIVGSNQFVWPSIIRLGREANFLNHEATALNLGLETLSTNSSPKRYLWDSKRNENEWRFINIGNEDATLPPIIEGLTCFINDDGTYNPEGYGIGAHYSRRSLMTFAFIEIIEQAITQINSFQSRERHDLRNTPRRLERVIITCPTAMSQVERQALYNSFADAVKIINSYNNIIDQNSISLQMQVIPTNKPRRDDDEHKEWYYDEATCSQFVYLYAEFCERYKNRSDLFFKLYGKRRMINDLKCDTLNVGSVDIGAGTTDVMVCQYHYNEFNPSQLKPNPIYWDSFNVAGDDMLQVLVQNVIIEGENGILYKHLTEKMGKTHQEAYKVLYHFFGQDNNMMTFKDRIMRRDFNMQVNVPVMYRFLNLLSEGERYREMDYDEMFGDSKPSDIVCEAFKNRFGFDLSEVVWTYDYNLLSQNVEMSLDHLIESISTLLYAHDCDIVVLSGRPTMLKPIKDCFLKYFPVSPNRLIVLGKHRIGRWYPFKDENGYMHDTKSIVPVGAMIGYLASMAGGLNEFSLDLSDLSDKLVPTTEMFAKRGGISKENCFITPTINIGRITINSFPCYIGAKQFDIDIYPLRPFYVLDIDDRHIMERINKKEELTLEMQQRKLRDYRKQLLNKAPFVFEIEREAYDEDKERLTIASVTGSDGENLKAEDFMLQVQSINDPQYYWLDSGEFNLNIATTDLNTKK